MPQVAFFYLGGLPFSLQVGWAQLRLAFTRGDGGLPRFWQPRFYDFNVWSKGKIREKLEYMHANPVTRKLVHHPKDWPWSSWSFYAKGEDGLVAIDSLW